MATTVVVTARARSRSLRAARSLGSIGKPRRSKRGAAAPRARGRCAMATCRAARGASRTGSSAGVTLVPGQEPGTARSAARRHRGQSSTCRTSSRRSAVLSTSWWSPVRRETLGQAPVSTTARAARVRSTSQAAEASSSLAAAASRPSTAATSWAASLWRTASSSASRCSGVVPAASGQASWASSRRCASWASAETGGGGVGGGLGRGGGGRLPLAAPARRVGALTFLLGLGQLAQTGPAGQRVQPGPAVAGGLAGRAGCGARRARGRRRGRRWPCRGRTGRTGSR